MTTKLAALQSWVDQVASQTQPDNIHWCSGSDDEYQELVQQMLGDGTLTTLNEKTYPNCYLHRSDPNDVARVEHLTYVCTESEEDAGQNNNWMSPADAHAKMEHGPHWLAVLALRRRDHRQPVRRRQHEIDDKNG
jgi:phosphoenolpyruvate carboxykinase (GTP)